jgi:hypothetical protein
MRQPTLPGQKGLDDHRVDDRPARDGLPKCPEQLIQVAHSLLEQVSQPGGSVLDQLERICRPGVLG